MTLQGIDVSAAGQGPDFPWSAWRNKISFAGVKISEGTGFADPDAERNIAGARSIGAVPVGYHFLHASQTGSAQAEVFLAYAHTAGLKPGDLIMVDCEDAGLDGEPVSVMNSVASTFAAELQRHFGGGFWPLCYTEISMGSYLTLMGNCPLWLANPSGATIKAIGPWRQVSFEQVSQRGVDCDVFYGDAAALAKLAFH